MPKRIVTAVRGGKSVIASEDVPESHRYQATPGFSLVSYWATPPIPGHPGVDHPAASGNALPPPGGTQLLLVTFPPDSIFESPDFDPGKAAEEQLRHMYDLASRFEPENPGMHTTPTVDYGIVIEGSIVLELDEGVTRELQPGDVVIQNGTRHAWRNPGGRAATLLFVLIGDAAAGCR